MTRAELEEERSRLRGLARRLLDHKCLAQISGRREMADDLFDAATVAAKLAEAPDHFLADEPIEA